MRTSGTVSAAAVTGRSAQGTNQTPAFTRIRASTLTWSSTAGRSGALTGALTGVQRGVQRGVLTEVQNMGLKEDLRGRMRMKMRRGTDLMGAVLRAVMRAVLRGVLQGVLQGAQEPVRPEAQTPGAPEFPGGRGAPEAPGCRGAPEAPEVPGVLEDPGDPGEVHDRTEAALGRTEVSTVIQALLSLVPGRLLTLTARAPAARTNRTTRSGAVV